MSIHNELVSSIVQSIQIEQNFIPQSQNFDYQESRDFISSYNPTVLQSLIQRSQIQNPRMIDQEPAFEPLTAREQLTSILLTLIKLDNKTVKGLFHEFHDILRKCYEAELHSFVNISNDETEKTFKEIVLLVKSFANIARAFLKWTYQDILDHYSQKLAAEEGGLFKPSYIISSIVYKLLFKNKKNTLNILLNLLMEKKYHSEHYELQAAIEKQQNINLYEEGYTKSNFSLPATFNEPLAYERTIQRIKQLKEGSDPYTKFERIISLENSLLKSVRDYHQYNPDKEQEIREQWESDIKIPLLVYCIIKSKNSAVLFDTKLVELFVSRRYWDVKTPNFIRFEIAVDAVLGKLS